MQKGGEGGREQEMACGEVKGEEQGLQAAIAAELVLGLPKVGSDDLHPCHPW